MARYNKPIQEITKGFHDFSSEDEKRLLNQFARMGFPISDEDHVEQPASEEQDRESTSPRNSFTTERDLS
ncbi:hypothetical protein [Secundilactobacillus kimchicus]|uniref:hypothetical protein n=1 Tax=Secundilactobacillus kimchicus TaxID=528209 RepID=UPI0006E46293|nr:hypothetical protein [Secundilactobacillus kimchicus]MBT9672461.1 hypothetical protein [Secundilactobacillus kimchicus]